MKKREIPKKNYLLLAIILLATTLLCIYFSSWYKMSEEAKMPKGIMTAFLPEVKIEELNNFLLENENLILYVSSSGDESIKRFEKNIHDYIAKDGYTHYFAYIDTTDVDMDTLKRELQPKTKQKKINFSLTPNMYVFKEGELVDTLYYSAKPLNSKEAIQFVEKQGIIE